MKKIIQPLSFAMIVIVATITMSSCVSTFYAPRTFVSFSGVTEYCSGTVADSNRVYYSECHNNGNSTKKGIVYTTQWYYNQTGDTVVSTSIPWGPTVSRTAPVNATVAIAYVPGTDVPGTFFYFAKITHAFSQVYCSPITILSPVQRVDITGPTPISGADIVCLGSSLTLSDTTPRGIWSSADTAIAAIDSMGQVATNGLGNTTIYYTDTAGCRVRHNLSVAGTATDSILGSDHVCVSSEINLTNPIGGGVWQISDTTVARINADGLVLGVAIGTTTISYSTGCGTPALQDIRVYDVSPIVSLDTICTGNPIQLANDSLGGHWSSSATAIASIDSAGLLTPKLNGKTTITYTSPYGCVAGRILTIYPTPGPIIGADPICPGGYQTLYIDGVVGGTWSTSDPLLATVTSSTQSSGVMHPLAEGVVEITYTNRCGTTSVLDTIRELPTPQLRYDTASSIIEVVGLYAGFQWYIDSAGVLYPNDNYYGFQEATIGTVYRVQVEDVNGCFALSEAFVYPNSTPVTGLKDISDNTVKIYPNPTSDILYIAMSGDVNYIISDMQGRAIHQKEYSKQVDVRHLAAGMYRIDVYRNDEIIGQGKFIKD